MAFKKVSDIVNVNKIRADVESKFKEVQESVINDFSGSDLDTDNIDATMAKYEKKLEKFEEISNYVDMGSKAVKFLTDPKGALVDLAKEYAVEKIENLPQVQELKNEAMGYVQEKIESIPEVQELKKQAEAAVGSGPSIQPDSNLMDIVDDPEQLAKEAPSAQALVEAAKRDSGFARSMLKSW